MAMFSLLLHIEGFSAESASESEVSSRIKKNKNHVDKLKMCK